MPDDARSAMPAAAQEEPPPMSSDARAMVTMPEPMSILTDFCDWASRQPDRTGKGVGDAKADNGRKDGVDRRRSGPYPGYCPWRGWQGPASSSKTGARSTVDENRPRWQADDELQLPGQGRARQQVLHLCEDGDRLIHIEDGGVAHDGDVDRIEPCIDDNTGKQTVDAHASSAGRR